jgi:transcriptional regulator with XRE-family HTH domain
MRNAAAISSSSSDEARGRQIRSELLELMKDRGWSLNQLAAESGLSRKSISGLIEQKGEITTRLSTLDRFEKFLSDEKKAGFEDKKEYMAIAKTMGASRKNEEFIEQYQHRYVVIRAHMPSRKALVSRLRITGDEDGEVVRYTHHHVVTDALSVFGRSAPPTSVADEENSEKEPVDWDEEEKGWLARTTIKYKGFVFNCQRRMFLVGTAEKAGHIKQMTLSLPAGADLSHASIRGLVLTISADEREPFSARVIVETLPNEVTKKERRILEPGLKNWSEMPEMIQREFNENTQYGLFKLHPGF